jgi:small subunit ribosomal protein S3
MGQKTHPLGFRLGITQKHRSKWYANFSQYPEILKQDDQIRTYLESISKENGISNVEINRNGSNDHIELNIQSGKPGILIGESGKGLENLLVKIKKIVLETCQVTINVFETEDINLNASLLGDFIVEQLERRVAFRRAMREALQRAQKSNVKGIKIQVSGRLNGAEMARSEWVREGRVPLQTLRADIEYATKEANTIYGILGIKIWVFKEEVLV